MPLMPLLAAEKKKNVNKYKTKQTISWNDMVFSTGGGAKLGGQNLNLRPGHVCTIG